MGCSREFHLQEVQSSVEAFEAGATNIRPWPEARELLGHDLLMGECAKCRSSITIEVKS